MEADKNMIPAGFTETTWLAEMQRMSREVGLTAPKTLDDARKPTSTTSEIPTDTVVRTRFATPGTACGRGTVRRISEAQLRYMRFLLNTRNYRKLIGAKWWPSTAVDHATTLAAVEFISLKGASTMIEGLLGCPERASVAAETVAEPMATPKQLTYLASLLAERVHGFGTPDITSLTMLEAKAMISDLIERPRVPVAAPTRTEALAVAGIYELDGAYYRMKKARNGNHFYAELLTDTESGAWEYARGMAHKVPAQGRKLSLEECEAFSALLGSCCMCSRELTATVNGVGPGARFLGPVCRSKMGF